MFMSIMSQYEICYCLSQSKHCSRFIINMELLWINLISSSNNLGCWTCFSFKTVYKDTILRKKWFPVNTGFVFEASLSYMPQDTTWSRDSSETAWNKHGLLPSKTLYLVRVMRIQFTAAACAPSMGTPCPSNFSSAWADVPQAILCALAQGHTALWLWDM